MAKSKNTSKKKNKREVVKQKVNKKSVDKKIDTMETSTSREIIKVLRVLFAVVVVLSAFYLLTVWIVGSDKKEEKQETTIQYDEILAGSSFGMRDDEYVVVYYDFTDTELTEITSEIYSYSYTGVYRLYTVDMNNGFNKPYATEEKANKSPKSVDELAINGPTLIKFKEGKVEKYVQGTEDIVKYLKQDK